MNNKSILMGAVIAVVVAGLYMMFAKSSQDADAFAEVVQEQPVAAVPEPVAPVQSEPVPEAAPVVAEQTSLGASSSGLGR